MTSRWCPLSKFTNRIALSSSAERASGLPNYNPVDLLVSMLWINSIALGSRCWFLSAREPARC